MTPPETFETEPASIVRALVNLSTLDLYFADQYLYRAEALLPHLCRREQYVKLRQDQDRLPSLAAALRGATERGDWARNG